MTADARTLLAKYGLRAKKSFGQNFLISERVFHTIVDAAVSAPDDWIVEIGAGLGTLTARLRARVPDGKVIAIERERDMIAVLRAELPDVDVEAIDALDYDLATPGRRVVVCGNLPYNIASQVLFRIAEQRAHVSRAVVMIQKEMADRVVASPATPSYGALGVLIKTYLDARAIAKVPPGAFVPAPRVDSTVLVLTPLPDDRPRVAIVDDAHYARVVHVAFNQRRKTLRNALRAAWPDPAVDGALAAAAVDGTRRGETLSIAEFATLAAALPIAAETSDA